MSDLWRKTNSSLFSPCLTKRERTELWKQKVLRTFHAGCVLRFRAARVNGGCVAELLSVSGSDPCVAKCGEGASLAVVVPLALAEKKIDSQERANVVLCRHLVLSVKNSGFLHAECDGDPRGTSLGFTSRT